MVRLVFAPLIGEEDEEDDVSKATYAAVGCLAQQVGVLGLKGGWGMGWVRVLVILLRSQTQGHTI